MKITAYHVNMAADLMRAVSICRKDSAILESVANILGIPKDEVILKFCLYHERHVDEVGAFLTEQGQQSWYDDEIRS